MKPVATIILNRNLPAPTDALYEFISQSEGHLTDVFVLEAGSDIKNVSKYMTWRADWPDALSNGLRYCRGMNYGIWKLWKEDKLFNYKYLFLLTNDVELACANTISVMMDCFVEHQHLGLLSPCSPRWGETRLLARHNLKYFWFIHNNAYMVSIRLLKAIGNFHEDHIDLLFDGNNFRGYGTEQELIAKSYLNDFAAGITSRVMANENEDYLLQLSDLIKTDTYEENKRLYLAEGLQWMRKKYGFQSHWDLNSYAKNCYERFFDDHPDLERYRV
jgi:hypothetical protein